MKGQNALVNEIFLFILGIMIASFVSVSMNSIEKRMTNISITDHMNEIADYVETGIVKASQSSENSSLIIKMDPYYGSQVYRIRLSADSIIVSLLDDERINVRREIFNISAGKIIFGEVTTSSEYVLIKSTNSSLEIKKWQGNWT